MTYEQPNEGTPVTFDAKMWGNALLWEHEEENGYTIVKNYYTGYWCYAVLTSFGAYTHSDSAVGINNPPTGINPHLRRSSACLARIENLNDDIDEALEDNYDAYQLRRDDPDTNRIGILFWEFDTCRVGEVDTGNPKRYTWDNVNLMFTSEGEFFGERHNMDAITPWGEEPFGSVRDYFLEMSGNSNDGVSIEAGGPFNNDSMLIINPIDEAGEIEWMRIEWNDSTWHDTVDTYISHSTVIDTAIARGLLDDSNDQPFDILILIHPGMNSPAGGFSWGINIRGRGYRYIAYGEWQSMHGHVTHGIVQSEKLTNVGPYCHEMIHSVTGFGHPADVGHGDVMYWGCNLAPTGGRDNATCTFGRGTNPCRPNPHCLDVAGWCQLEEITGDTMGLVIEYSASNPSIYYYDYDASHDTAQSPGPYHGRFFLENRQMVDAEEEHDDFNSFSMGSYEWERPVGSSLNKTEDVNNLHIWHREGYLNLAMNRNRPRLRSGLYLERADAEYTNTGDGNDLYPGADNIEEFGPGTGVRQTFIYGVTNFLVGSSHDVFGTSDNIANGVLQDYRELQTGFCVKEITPNDTAIICDVYTNYWGGDIREDLTLSGDNLYIGQNAEIYPNYTVEITPTDSDEDMVFNLDSDLHILGTGALILRCPRQPNRLLIETNGFDIIVDHLATLSTVKYDAGESGWNKFIAGGGSIIIRGEWEIDGNDNNAQSCDPNPDRGDWGGIVFEDVTTTQTISNLTISHVENGITVDDCGSYLTFDNVTVTDFQNYGFNLISSSPTMENCSASNSTPSGAIQPVGLYCYNSSPKATDCDFDNNYKGVEVYGTSSTLEMGTTTADDNASDGFFVYDGFAYLYYSATKPDYGYNSFISNGGNGVSAGGYAGVYMGSGTYSPGNNLIYSNYSYDVANYTTFDVQAEYNWWGDVLGPTSIYGTVDYTPWLTSTPGSFAPEDNGEDLGTPFSASTHVRFTPENSGDNFVDGVDDDEDDLFLYADSLFNCGDMGDALAVYQEIVADYPNDARILNVVRRIRDCFKGLDRNNDWRQDLQGFNQDERLRAQVRPKLIGLRVHDMLENGETDAAANILRGTLRELNRNNDAYPTLLFQLGMLYHYSQNDPLAASEVFRRFMNAFEGHPLYRSAAVEYAVCIREGEDIDSPGQPENMKGPELPTAFSLHPPFPNPFNDVVTIRFATPQMSQVSIRLFDVLGREVREVTNQEYKAGIHNIQVSGSSLDSGVYFCQMTASGFEQTRKLVYVK